METLTITYTASVLVQAGWRSITVRAKADRVSPGMARVTEVLTIDGETPGYGMTRTGAKRQSYNGHAIARREVGSRKRISACSVEPAALEA